MEKQAMVNSALATGDFLNLHAGNKALLCLPMDYIAGKMMFVRALILGLDLDFIEPTSNPLKNNNTNYDFVAMVPLQVENSIKKLVQVKKLIVGGTSINHSLQKELINLPTQIFETYGMTETCTHVAAKKIGTDIFNALPNVSFSINDRNCLTIDASKISSEKIITNDNNRLEVVVFKLADEEYAFPIERVSEIIDTTAITPVASSPNTVEGVINIRGQIVTIGSLHKQLAIIEHKSENQKIIICQANKGRIGFFVDSVSNVMSVSKDEVISESDQKKIFSAVLHLNQGERLVMLFDLESLRLVRG
jgi:chemotaxis signal transduction protein